MAQSAGPISQGTTAERQFTDVMWRDLFGDEPGVIGDLDGSAYALSLPSGSDVASVGSTTQASVARLAGFAHRIPTNSPEPITIPAASGSTRTDIIALRYDPSFTGAPGPVRLVRISGTSSLLPAYDAAPPGVEDLPLWAITRNVGQNLSQATTQRLYPRLVPMLDIPVGAPLPTSSPLGAIAWQGPVQYRRELGTGGVPGWVPWASGVQDFPNGTLTAGWAGTSLAWQGTGWAWVPSLGAKTTIPASSRSRTVKLTAAAGMAGDIWLRIRADLSGGTQHFPNPNGRRSQAAQEAASILGRFTLPAGQAATVYLEARAQAQGSGSIYVPQLDVMAF